MFKIIIICIVIALIVLSIFHIKKYVSNPKEDNLQLKQMETYDYEKAEEIMNEKNLLIIRNYKKINNLINEKSLLKFNKQIKFVENTTTTIKNVLQNKHDSFLLYKINFNDNKLSVIKQFGSDLSIQNNIFVSYGKANLTTSIICLQYNRNFLHIIKGSIRICLFSPNYRKDLYLNKSKGNPSILSSKIDLQNPEYLLYPEYKDIENEYIEMILRKGNLLFIPNKWSFYIKYIENTTMLQYTFDTMVSKMFKFF